MGYPEDSRLKANGEMDCGSQQYVLGRLYVQNIEVLCSPYTSSNTMYDLQYGPIRSYMMYPEDSRLKANGEKDCGRQQYVSGGLYVQNVEVLC